MEINRSIEDYLETILILSKRLPVVRSIDIAKELSYSKPSISIAMRKLVENNYATMSETGAITLTDAGLKIAKMMYERHTVLSNWLTYLGVDPHQAVEDACRMEHVLSAESFSAIKAHILKTNEISKK
jgi:Mn-dependent DtxR family transcriptional regulator